MIKRTEVKKKKPLDQAYLIKWLSIHRLEGVVECQCSILGSPKQGDALSKITHIQPGFEVVGEGVRGNKFAENQTCVNITDNYYHLQQKD